MPFESLWLFITISFFISATPGQVMLAAMLQGISWLASQQHPGSWS